MKIVATGCRLLLGLVFVVFGLNIFLHFIPTPAPAGDANTLMTLMYMHGWFKVIGFLEVLGGLLLLSGYCVPLGLTILGPILLNIVVFHSLFAPNGLALALFWTLLELYLIYAYRAAFEPVLNPRARPFSEIEGDAVYGGLTELSGLLLRVSCGQQLRAFGDEPLQLRSG